MSLTLLLATRNRPALCIETIERTLQNIAMPSTKLVVAIDKDDSLTVQELSLFALDHKKVILSIKDREDSLGEKYNRALQYAAKVYMPMVDYAPQMTPGFDQIVCNAAAIFPDNIGCVMNRNANASFAEIYGVTHGLAKKMGFIFPPWFPYWFVDHWLEDIARMIDRISYADIKIDRAKRPGTQDLRDLQFWATLYNALHLRRRQQAADIIDAPDFIEPMWRKKLSHGNYHRVEYYSEWLNNGMIADAKNIEPQAGKGIPDEMRYVRIKQRGLELMKSLIPELTAEEARKAA